MQLTNNEYRGGDGMRRTERRTLVGKVGSYLLATAAALGVASGGTVNAQETFKVGVVTFLSGGAAESFGVPAWNGGKLLIDMLNEGGVLPAPYDQKGFGGMTIEAIPVDEAGGATKQVQEFRKREEVDTVLGYVSSGDCLAIAPVADELKAFTILYDCGTPRVFEEGSYEYVFHAAMDNISLAKYLDSRGIEVSSYAGINQDYAWGQDSWADFDASMSVIQPDAESGATLFPKIYAGQYGTEISALTREGADTPAYGAAIFRRSFCRQHPEACSNGARSCWLLAIMSSHNSATRCRMARSLARVA